MNAETCQMAADLWTKPTYLTIGPPVGGYETTSTIAISPKTDTHFTIPVPQRVEGPVDLDGWLHTQQAVTHPSGTGPSVN